MRAFISPLAAIARALSSTFSAVPFLGKAHKDSDRDHCRLLTLTCRNSPCWRCCERCNNFLSSPWAAIADSID